MDIKKKNTKYAEVGKKFCEGICNREIVGKLLVCHGCKRIVANFKNINIGEKKYENN